MNGLSALVSPVAPASFSGRGRVHLIAKQRSGSDSRLLDAPAKRAEINQSHEDRIECAVVMLESGFCRLDVEKAILYGLSKSTVNAALNKFVADGLLSTAYTNGAKKIYTRVEK